MAEMMRSGSGYILKRAHRFQDELDVDCEKKKEVKDEKLEGWCSEGRKTKGRERHVCVCWATVVLWFWMCSIQDAS